MTRTFTALLVTAAVLAGCATAPPPVLVNNTRLSEAVKARSFKSYREVLLVPPRSDPRQIGPRLKSQIEAMGYQVRLMDPTKSIEAPQGTAFVVGAEGWMLTCAHVMGQEKVGTITLNGQRLLADVVKSDAKADLALLKLREPLPAGTAVLPFRTAAKPTTMGEDVFTIGYPLSRMLGNTARMSRGLLSATAGLRDNQQEVQVSAEIHPGNSGGPLLDKDGQVIGVVHKIINPAAVQRATGGALPQNINFAIKGQPVLDFLRAADGRAYAAVSFDKPAGMEAARPRRQDLDAIKARGTLVCGVNTGLAGFSAADSQGNWTGLDVDYCRPRRRHAGRRQQGQVGAADAQQRFTALQSGEIDILSRNTTWTLTRDASLGMHFVGVTYYDGQGFMVPPRARSRAPSSSRAPPSACSRAPRPRRT
jgi:serine protease Do